MALLTTVTSASGQNPPDVTEAPSASSDTDSFDKSVVAGVIAAVFLTLFIVLAVVAVYMYKHKGTYRTNEADEEEEAHKALQMNNDPGEDKQEYMM
ncbi:small cell adhesion glycoprotein [Eleutherodactylus coqui]|uniref:Small cell adhesion glycoprotein n=1 Tax=Eleutherodactylus coqui TaxID=57060 RepID=A0A8J6FPA6_ELECQ|nr:hypothetical protein GDO78_000247 [Eleutherodactylus coqui]KAG9491637.1 hypothetical protein GDO78_000247 [Eleutherodactylus coqui]KAG9491638.1 hypothetical protein GDO78_000247 [Eleutherodactylus coqui]